MLRAADGLRRAGRHNPYNAIRAMIPVLPKELFMSAVETVCYFCTAVGVLLTFILMPRK